MSPSDKTTKENPAIRWTIENAERLSSRVERLKQKRASVLVRVKKLGSWRLTTGAVFFFALAIAISNPSWRVEAPLIAIFLAAFIPMVIRSRRLKEFADNLDRLSLFNERQIARLRGEAPVRANTEHAEKAARALNGEVRFPFDLGLVGPLSLFSLIDETLTDQGQARLLSRMAEPPRSSAELRARQATIRGLAREVWLYTRLTLTVKANEFRLSSAIALDTIKRPFVGEGFQTNFVINICSWVVAIAAAIYGSTTGKFNAAFPMAVYVGIGFWTLNRTEGAFHKAVGLENHLWRLAPIFARLEKRLAHTPQSSELTRVFATTKDFGPSREMRKLSRVLSFAGIQANPILHLLINAFLPWSITASYFLEKTRKEIERTLPRCIEELAEFEALMSLALVERYQTHTYPVIEEHAAIELEGGFHPLIKRTNVVANDFHFDHGKCLGLLTGSNMSGKSTFLRTLGLNQILANMGAPVFALRFATSPYRIETCIEVSDSLRDGFSYFYAEVRRLKELLECARSSRPTPVLYLIDEIFRGTNNRERQIGSRAVIRALASTEAVGFISTHDLELTHLEETQTKLENFHFREEIIELADGKSEMHFTYHLNRGPCPTTNALRIMADEGIDVSGLV